MTAHDPRVTLTDAEREALRVVPSEYDGMPVKNLYADQVVPVAERIIAARLAPIRALTDIEDCGHPTYYRVKGGEVVARYPGGWCSTCSEWLEDLRAALDAPVSASQDHDGAEGQGEGEKAADRRCPTCGIPFAHYTHDPQGRPL